MDRLLDAVKEHTGYDQWRDVTTFEENLFVWRFNLSSNEFPGWEPEHIQTIESEQLHLTLWKPSTGDMRSRLQVDIHECRSRVAAHDSLVSKLRRFDIPRITRLDDAGFGDVAFASPHDACVVYARANLVLQVSHATWEPFGVTELARQFDERLIGRPNTSEGKDAPQILRFDCPAKSYRVGETAPLELEAADPAGQLLWYKFYSRSGEVLLDAEGQLCYRPDSPGEQTITLYAINADGKATSQELAFVVK